MLKTLLAKNYVTNRGRTEMLSVSVCGGGILIQWVEINLEPMAKPFRLTFIRNHEQVFFMLEGKWRHKNRQY